MEFFQNTSVLHNNLYLTGTAWNRCCKVRAQDVFISVLQRRLRVCTTCTMNTKSKFEYGESPLSVLSWSYIYIWLICSSLCIATFVVGIRKNVMTPETDPCVLYKYSNINFIHWSRTDLNLKESVIADTVLRPVCLNELIDSKAWLLAFTIKKLLIIFPSPERY